MIINGKSVIGLHVITVNDGKVVETVDDIAYDPEAHQIVALLLSSGGLFSSAKGIGMDDIHNIGEDAVIINDASVIKSVKELGNDIRSISDANKHLVKTTVVTVDGKQLGKVSDIFFESTSGVVESMEVSQGGLKNLAEGKKSIKPADIITIGADATIVSNYIEKEFEAQSEEGGLKGALNDVKEKASEIAEDTKENIQSLSEAAKDKASELKDKAAVKADELREDTQKRIEDAKTTVDKKTDEARVKTDELRDTVKKKADELKDAAEQKLAEVKNNSHDLQTSSEKNLEDLADTVKEKSRDVTAAAKVKAREVKESLPESTHETKERIHDGKEKLKARTSR